MKNASQWALLSGALVLGMAYACATPEEIHGCPSGSNIADCDVTLVAASEFETPDASVQVGQGGSNGLSPSGGGSGAGVTPPSGGAAGTGSPPSGGSAGQGAGGSGQSAGAGGASGGTAGSGAGTGGVAGAAGTAGTGGAAGTTGTGGTTAQSNFDPAACNFTDRTGCEAFACATACPANNTNCLNRCPQIISCVAAAPTCISEADPMCGIPITSPMFMNNICTSIVQQSGNVNTTDPNAPAFRARALIQCLCDDTRL